MTFPEDRPTGYPERPDNEQDLATADAHTIARYLWSMPTTEELSTAGYEILDETGRVDFLSDSGQGAGGVTTYVTRLPLAQYETGSDVHDVTLFGVTRTDGSITRNHSIFAVDQATRADGTQYLASNPAILYRDEGGYNRSAISDAIMYEAGGPAMIMALIEADYYGEESVAAEIRSKMAEALSQRPHDEASTVGLTERHWGRVGVNTPERIRQRVAAVEYEKQRMDQAWEEASLLRKAAAWLVAMYSQVGRYDGDYKAAHADRMHRKKYYS